MALPLPPGLTPPEIAFLCEMELITIIPRQRLEGLELLGVCTPPAPHYISIHSLLWGRRGLRLISDDTQGPLRPLNPPHRTNIPLWLALLLKRQRRANILPPPWLNTHSLSAILDYETDDADTFSPPPRLPPQPSSNTFPVSPPFLLTSTAEGAPDALPYHWLELGEMLLEAASDDIEDPDNVRIMLRGLREVRMAKLRRGAEVLDAAGGFKMNGVGGMEVGEGRAFVTGVIDGLRYGHWSLINQYCMSLLTSPGKLRLRASSSGKIETARNSRMDIPGDQATTMTMKWICNKLYVLVIPRARTSHHLRREEHRLPQGLLHQPREVQVSTSSWAWPRSILWSATITIQWPCARCCMGNFDRSDRPSPRRWIHRFGRSQVPSIRPSRGSAQGHSPGRWPALYSIAF